MSNRRYEDFVCADTNYENFHLPFEDSSTFFVIVLRRILIFDQMSLLGELIRDSFNGKSLFFSWLISCHAYKI